MTDKRYRVSAKQRLELIKKAWEDFKAGVQPDIDRLQEEIENAFSSDLEPKNKVDDEAPF